MAAPPLANLRPPPAARDAAVAELKALFGERLSTAAAVREQHGKDESYHAPVPPDAVVFARIDRGGAAIVKLCAAHKTPVIPFGTGTSLEGHIGALQRRRLASTSPQMNRVLRVNAEDLDVHRRARRHAQAAQRTSARHRAVLPDRSRRRRLASAA